MEYTYNGIKEEIRKKLIEKSKWKKTIFLGTYERIIDAVAYIIDKVVYIAEFLYKESKYKTATKKESILIQAEPLHYKAHRKKGARGIVLLSADPEFKSTYQYDGYQVKLDRWTVLTDANKSIKTYLDQDYFYYTGQIGNLELSVAEGTPKTYTYVALGEISESFNIYSENIDNDEVEVFIVSATGDVLHDVEVVDNLYFVLDTERYTCEVKTELDQKSVVITFGDNITAKKLTSGEYVLVKYAETKGDQGDINSQDIITSFEDVIYDAKGNAVNLYLTNTEAITGGTDVESMESIKQNANNLFMSGYRLGSISDWETLLASVGYIYKAKVWTIEGAGGSSASAEQNQVFITAISSDGENLTTAQQNELVTGYINLNKSLTEAVSFQDFQKIYLKFETIAKIENASIDIMDQAIKQKLEDTYGILSTDFKKPIYESNFYEIINSIDNVVYHTTNIYYIEKNLSPLLSNYKILSSFTTDNTSILEKQIYLLEDSLKVLIKRKIGGSWLSIQQIGYTSGTSILGMNGYNITGGNIIYLSNLINWNIASIINSSTENLIPAYASDFTNPAVVDYYSANTGNLTYNVLSSDGNYEANGTLGDNTLYKEGLVKSGLTYKITFRAKSTSLTSKPEVYLDETKADDDVVPDLTTTYQDYEYTCLAPDEGDNSFIIKFGSDLVLGSDITIDTIVIKEQLPEGSFGVRNPGDSDQNGYVLYIEYKTKDGNEQQSNSVRFTGFNQITDIEKDDFVTTSLSYLE